MLIDIIVLTKKDYRNDNPFAFIYFIPQYYSAIALFAQGLDMIDEGIL